MSYNSLIAANYTTNRDGRPLVSCCRYRLFGVSEARRDKLSARVCGSARVEQVSAPALFIDEYHEGPHFQAQVASCVLVRTLR